MPLFPSLSGLCERPARVLSRVAFLALFASGCGTSAPGDGVGGTANVSGASQGGGGGSALGGSTQSAGAGTESAGTGGGATPGTPATTKLSGGFSVNLDALSAVTSVGGNVYAGEQPATELWTPRVTAGACTLRVPSQPFCDPACGADACVEGNRCVPYPKPVSVGSVSVSGLGASDFSMEPKGDTFYYVTPPGIALPYPPTADGAKVRFAVTGGDFGPFVLEGEGISPLEITSKNPLEITPGAPLAITWTPGASTQARVSVELDLSHHGGTKGQVICELEDTGSVTLSSELVTELVGLGVAGFPMLDIARTSKVQTSVAAGSVELGVRSSVRLDVSVPGLVSCSDSEDCPSGQTCESDQRCQ